MKSSKLQAKQLLSLSLAFGLVVSSTLTSAWGADITPVAFENTSTAPVAEQSSTVGRVVAIGVGVLGGAVIYSLATWDWGWAVGLLSMEVAGARAAGSVATGAVARVVGVGAPAAARVAGVGAPAVAARVVGATRAPVAAARAGVAWGWRWVLLPAMAIAGGFVGNGIYGNN